MTAEQKRLKIEMDRNPETTFEAWENNTGFHLNGNPLWVRRCTKIYGNETTICWNEFSEERPQ